MLYFGQPWFGRVKQIKSSSSSVLPRIIVLNRTKNYRKVAGIRVGILGMFRLLYPLPSLCFVMSPAAPGLDPNVTTL